METMSLVDRYREKQAENPYMEEFYFKDDSGLRSIDTGVSDEELQSWIMGDSEEQLGDDLFNDLALRTQRGGY